MDHDDVIKWKHFRVTVPLCGEFTGHRWIPLTKASDAELWCFLWSAPEHTFDLLVPTIFGENLVYYVKRWVYNSPYGISWCVDLAQTCCTMIWTSEKVQGKHCKQILQVFDSTHKFYDIHGIILCVLLQGLYSHQKRKWLMGFFHLERKSLTGFLHVERKSMIGIPRNRFFQW